MDHGNDIDSAPISGAQQGPASPHPMPIPPLPGPSQTTKCSARSQDQVVTLLQARTLPELECPLCKQQFQLRKTLYRHINTAIAQFRGKLFRCTQCPVLCTRKDILVRHVATMHGLSDSVVTCKICGQQVRQRSLKGHRTSQACKTAAEQPNSSASRSIDDTEIEVAHAAFTNYNSIAARLHNILDCVLLSGWLFATIEPWGHGQNSVDQWLLRSPPVQSYEIRKLKYLVIRALRKAVSIPSSTWDQSLFDAILVLTMCTTFTDGWTLTPTHQDAILLLACGHLSTRTVTREEFIGRPISDSFSHVIFNTIRKSEREKCEQVIHLAIALMRSSSFDYVVKLSSNFTQTPSRSAISHQANELRAEEFAADYGHHMVEISEIAGSVEGI